MIPQMYITAWSKHAPWPERRQIEQDLIISRAIVELFSDAFLMSELRFRGGTALNKLHFPEPLRFSEDIDLVRTTAGPIKPLLISIRKKFEPWLGIATFQQSPISPKLFFYIKAEDGSQMKLKLEINTRERDVYDEEKLFPFKVENPWFSGECRALTFSNEEMLATKLRALLQRDKGRDLFDLSHSLANISSMDHDLIIHIFQKYLQKSGQNISRAQAEQRLFSKLAHPRFLSDMRPLVRKNHADFVNENAGKAAFSAIFKKLLSKLPGDPWARTEEFWKKFGL